MESLELYADNPHVHEDPDVRCPHCNGPCATNTEHWETTCLECNWTTQYADPEDAFLLSDHEVSFLLAGETVR